jgi:GT2 family glycosyltransferase
MFKKLTAYIKLFRSGYFDTRYYLSMYPDVRKADVYPLTHYILHGWKEGRLPSMKFYLDYFFLDNPNLRAEGIDGLIKLLKTKSKTNKLEQIQAVEQNKVGIVIVSYNASLAIRATLASLRKATIYTPFELILIDNASSLVERNIIKKAFDRHVVEANLPWRYVQLEENKGFSGGNNVGIKMFLQDDSISHICLLNSDVILSDYWLDRLVAYEKELVSPVTNMAESIQAVPIDYSIELISCMDNQNEEILEKAFNKVNKFSQKWHEAWKGNLTETEEDVTFFCVLLSKGLVNTIGLLDPTFFPGGYEDYDYCARVRNRGAKTFLARDVFIHHWGSASFNLLTRNVFNENSIRNRKYLEEKHKIELKSNLHTPFISYAQDVRYALSNKGDVSLQVNFLGLYDQKLTELLKHRIDEFVALRNDLSNSNSKAFRELKRQALQLQEYKTITSEWQINVSEINKSLRGMILSEDEVNEIINKLESIAKQIQTLILYSIEISKVLYEAPGALQVEQQKMPVINIVIGFLRKLKKGAVFLFKLKGIVFFGGYPYPERERDGYFQRIRSVDSLFLDRWRIYFDRNYLPGRDGWYDYPEKNVLVIHFSGSRVRKILSYLLLLICVIRCRKVYFHSVLSIDHGGLIFRIPGIKKIIDVHGVVPEEFLYHEDQKNSGIYNNLEKIAIERANYIIVVSNAMREHLKQKYSSIPKGQIIIMPIFQDMPTVPVSKTYLMDKPIIVYAGGLQKWQQIPKMIDAVQKTVNNNLFRIYCPNPEEFIKMLPVDLKQNSNITVDSKPNNELLMLFEDCHYGFIFREDVIVNRVACPTKLIEYLAKGIVPVVDFDNIGDFKEMGMMYVKLEDFLSGKLPKEETRNQMVENNITVYDKIKKLYALGAETLREVIDDIREG